MWGSWRRRIAIKRVFTSLTGQSFQVFVNIWSVTLFLHHSLTSPWTLAKTYVEILLRQIPLQRPMATCTHLLWGGATLLFNPQKASCTCTDRDVFLDLRGAPYLFALAELNFATRFVLKCLGNGKLSFILLLTNTRCVQPRGSLSHTSAAQVSLHLLECQGRHPR